MWVTIKKSFKDSPTNLCRIPAEIMKELRLSEGTTYTLAVGNRRADAVLASTDDDTNMHVPNSIFQRLLVFSDYQLNISANDHTIYLGPVVGVFIGDLAIRNISEGKPPISVMELTKANKQGHCLLYYFTIPDDKWRSDKVKGYIFHPRYRTWKAYWMPLPNVVYDRGVGFRSEDTTLAYDVLDTLRSNPNIQFINRRAALSKWRTYKALSRHPNMQRYLPETVVYRSFSDLEYMLKKYNFIFVKSFWGSHGKEVMAVEKKGESYELTLYRNGLKTILAHDLDRVRDSVLTFTDDRRCIVQKGIRLFRIHNQPFDLRVQLNKDRQGKWKAISNYARISKKRSLITNYALGGNLVRYQDLYAQIPNLLPTNRKVSKTAIVIASYLEKEFGEMGEIGLDLAIDEDGRIWMIEANSKPDKNPVPGLDDTEGISPQFLATLEYAQYLAREARSRDIGRCFPAVRT